MFTGLVEEVGTLAHRYGDRFGFRARAVLGGTRLGDSIAIDGVCLTVVHLDEEGFEVQVVAETLARTTLGELTLGAAVNLERSLAVGDRLGGHLVQGHVDCVGTVTEPGPALAVALAGDSGSGSGSGGSSTLARYLAEKGSVAVDGVSLTVAGVSAQGFSAALVPHTMSVTTLGRKARGSRVNLEFDVVAKYVERLVGFTRD